MKKIKFSHMYDKLKHINIKKPVHLVECLRIELNQLSEEFLNYDTLFFDEKGNLDNYELKEGSYLILFFVDSDWCLFTTIRRQTPNKNKYYFSSIGEEFEVIVN